MKRGYFVAALLGLVAASYAQVTNYTDANTWQTTVDYYSTIRFTTYPNGTVLSNQYAGAGVTFDGQTDVLASSGFTTDGMGIDHNGGAVGPITITFDHDISAFGTDFPGGAQYTLWEGNTQVGTSAQFGGVGTGFFGGVISGTAFNTVVLSDYVDDTVYIDNIYWGAGSAVPEPASMVALGLGGALLLRRKRRI